MRTLAIFAMVCLAIVAFACWFFIRSACLTVREFRTTVADLTFHYVETNCDTLAKEEVSNIYVSEPAKTETLLFSYDPVEGSLPAFRVGPEIEISLERISAVEYRAKKWQGKRVNFRIGHINYP